MGQSHIAVVHSPIKSQILCHVISLLFWVYRQISCALLMPDSNRIAGRVYVLFWEQLRCAYNTVNHFRAWNIKIVDIYPRIHFKYLLYFTIIFLKFDIFYIYSYNVRFKILSKGNSSLIIFDILIKIFFFRMQAKKIPLNWLKYWIRHADCILLHLDWDLNCFRKKPYSNEKGISSSTL